MAIGAGAKNQSPQESNDGYLSDDSSFYGLYYYRTFPTTNKNRADPVSSGDTPTKRDLNNRAASFSAATYWSQLIVSPTAMALANAPSTKMQVKLHNPYEGSVCGRQLGETVDDFLKRLPPLTTPQCEEVPWIFIANPYQDAPSVMEGEQTAGQWAAFVEQGGRLLLELRTFQAKLNQRERSGKMKLYNDQREKIVKQLRDMAIELKCTSGKVCTPAFCSIGRFGSLY